MNRLGHDEVRLDIGAAPEWLYDLVSDVPRTPEWSPEVIACRWLDGVSGAAPGARFSARNKKRWFAWSNRPVVETAERGREFAITRTEPGGGTIRWYYRFEPAAGGTSVVLGYQVLQAVPRTLHVILRTLLGVRDLRADLHQNMIASLDAIDEIAARQASGSPSAATARTSKSASDSQPRS
jgi:Polyketide cyclase / dehydrase and lipid transport